MNQEKKYTLLYADDEKNVRENYLLFMQNYFDKIYTAKDGQEAYEFYEDYKPDVVILDIEMPRMSGLEVAKKIRETDSDTKIIILTAYSDKERLLEAIKLNLVDYLVKPIDRGSLKRVLTESFASIEKKDEHSFINLSDDIKLDTKAVLLYEGDNLIDLTSYEQKLLALFYTRRNQIVSKTDIYDEVWDSFDKEFSDSSIRNLVKNLRKKIPEDCLDNVYGSGYIFKI